MMPPPLPEKPIPFDEYVRRLREQGYSVDDAVRYAERLLPTPAPSPEGRTRTDRLVEELRGVGFSPEEAQRYASRARPSRVLRSTQLGGVKLALGESRFGGMPDIPPDFCEWPHFRGRPLPFIAQIDLSVVRSKRLPAEGWLLFFCGDDEMLVADEGYFRPSRVLYFSAPRDALKRIVAAPDGYPHPDEEPCRMGMRRSLDLPIPYDLTRSLYGGNDDLRAQSLAYFLVQRRLEEPLWQGHRRGNERTRRGHDFAAGRLLGHETPQQPQIDMRSKLPERGTDWELLLEVDDGAHPQWNWGDAGSVYFWVRKSDRRARRFGKARLTEDCG